MCHSCRNVLSYRIGKSNEARGTRNQISQISAPIGTRFTSKDGHGQLATNISWDATQ